MSGCGKRVQGRGGKTRSKTTCGEASCCGGRCYRRRRGSNFVGYGLNALEAAEGWLCLRNPRRRGPAWRRSDCCAPRLCSLAALLCAGSAWRFTARSRPGICRYAGVVVQLPKRYKVSAVSPCISREAAAAPIAAVSAATTHQRMDVAYSTPLRPRPMRDACGGGDGGRCGPLLTWTSLTSTPSSYQLQLPTSVRCL